MSVSVLAVVLAAAFLHATWNAILKAAPDTSFGAVLVAAAAAPIAVAGLLVLPAPARESWPFLVASSGCQVAYFSLLAVTYRTGDMSATYPLMRGTAPLIVALAAGPLAGEALTRGEWAGLATICGGVMAMAVLSGRGASGKATAFALLNAVVIASYTLIDGIGVRRSGAPVAYTLWIILLPAVVLVAVALVRHGRAFTAYARRNALLGLCGGVATMTSYGLALWAMTQAPVAVVAALRETSIVFATGISALVLHEKVGRARAAVAVAIAAGAVVLRLG